MKKVKVLVLVLCVVVSFAFAGCSSKDETAGTKEDDGKYSNLEPVELIGADSTAQGAAGQVWGEYVAERVSELTDGKLTIDYHPNGELGGDMDLIRQMIDGDIDLVVCQTAPMVSFVPEMAAFDLPMAFAKYDGETIDKVLNGENDFTEALDEAFESQGLFPLGFLQNATYRLTTANKELRTISDFGKLQIRTMENANHMAFWKAIGAEPTPLAWAEVYFSLSNGTIDAQENAADTCVGANFQEVQKYLCCTNHILYCNQMCINNETFQSLDPLYQEALLQAVSEATNEVMSKLSDIDESGKKTLEEGGMTIIEYDESFFDEILSMDSVRKVYSDIDESINGLGTTLVTMLSEEAEK